MTGKQYNLQRLIRFVLAHLRSMERARFEGRRKDLPLFFHEINLVLAIPALLCVSESYSDNDVEWLNDKALAYLKTAVPSADGIVEEVRHLIICILDDLPAAMAANLAKDFEPLVNVFRMDQLLQS